MSDVGAFWDERFAGREFAYGPEPNSFLVGQRYRLEPGMRVLVPGDGEGRNGVWLAQQGMKVLSVDASAVGLQKAARLALDRGVTVRTVCADLREWEWPRDTYDAVAAVFLHFRPEDRAAMHRAMFRALVPGGLFLLEAFTPEQLALGTGGPRVPEMLYAPETLRADLPGAEFLELEDGKRRLDEGAHHSGIGHTVRLVARRPAVTP